MVDEARAISCSRDLKQQRSGVDRLYISGQLLSTYAKSRYEHGDLVVTLRGRGLGHRGGVGGRDRRAVVSHAERVGVNI